MDQAALPPDFAANAAGRLTKTAPKLGEKLGDKIGDFLSLDGATVETPSVKPNGVVHVELVLHAEKRVPTGWRRFVHLVASDGRRYNADSEPLGGMRPIADLKAGLFIRDRVEIRLPAWWPRGKATVEIGAFRGAVRAKATGPHASNDAVRIGQVVVE
jgi:hypothetical protein